MVKLFLGIDLGGTEIKLAIVDEKGNIIESGELKNDPTMSPKKLCEDIVDKARGMKDFRRISGTGIGVAGDIDQKRGVVRFSPNLPRWKNANLRILLGRDLPKPIVVDNDANAAALGAFWLETKGKAHNLLCVTLGTGVGGGIICEGKLYRGASGTAGEIGHMPYNPDGPECNCGSRGCIERYIGAPNMSFYAREGVRSGKSPMMHDLVGGNLEKITPKVIAEAARKGDAYALKMWKEAGEKLGIVLAGVINLINPEMIILAGGISKANELLLEPVRITIRERAFATPTKKCKINISKYDQKLGVVGAALLAK